MEKTSRYEPWSPRRLAAKIFEGDENCIRLAYLKAAGDHRPVLGRLHLFLGRLLPCVYHSATLPGSLSKAVAPQRNASKLPVVRACLWAGFGRSLVEPAGGNAYRLTTIGAHVLEAKQDIYCPKWFIGLRVPAAT